MDYKKLIQEAIKVNNSAYTPYYKFKVGASVMSKNGQIFIGCNVENITPAPCCCAEQVAITSAVANGHRDFVAIAVYGNGADYCFPCGSCRQLIVEFNPDMDVIVAKSESDFKVFKASDLLPHFFSPKNLKQN
ncbi:MAG: cytidine deaminase [Christensenellales bacterium]